MTDQPIVTYVEVLAKCRQTCRGVAAKEKRGVIATHSLMCPLPEYLAARESESTML